MARLTAAAANATRRPVPSAWPPQTLIQQQELTPAQPEFAESYLWLGDQYQKAGRSDEARTVWQRGAALFPSDEKLRTKLTSVP